MQVALNRCWLSAVYYEVTLLFSGGIKMWFYTWFLGLLLFVFNPLPAQAQGTPLQGEWATEWGAASIYLTGSSYYGTYEEDNGQFLFYYENEAWTGIWAEDQSDVKCTTKRLGTYYWGRLALATAIEPDGFLFRWGYCESGDVDRDWQFIRKTGFENLSLTMDPNVGMNDGHSVSARGVEALDGNWRTDWGDASVYFDGSGFHGTYVEDNGQFEIYPDGRIWSGFWAETMADQKCSYERLGTYYWGRLRLDTPVDTSGFSFKWGYCESGPIDRTWGFTEKIR